MKLPAVMLTLAVALIVLSIPIVAAQDASAQNLPDAPPYYSVEYPGSEAAGELVFAVKYTVWIPPDVDQLRGVIVHQHGCGVGACQGGETAAYDLHWQALAQKHQCALVGPTYKQPEGADCGLWCDPRNGSDIRFRKALDDLASKSGHPELSTVPWALWGHSGGGVWVGTMLILHPQRVAAVWLRSGTPRMVAEANSKLPSMEYPTAALQVPVMCNLGAEEGVTVTDGRFSGVWPKNKDFFQTVRGAGGLIGVAVEPNCSHQCGNSRYLAIPWFDACLAARLPSKAGDPLQPIDPSTGWLAELLSPKVFSVGDYAGDVKSASWLPSKTVAHAYSQYVTDANVSDETPPPAPTGLKLDGNVLTWNADADFESGIQGFNLLRGGKIIAKIPTEAKRGLGRSIFQINSYHDTPSQPLIQMRYEIPKSELNTASSISVQTINSVDLVSEPASLSK
jgi:pimeloyl-ACP methyl ester carboxylesterase